MIEKYDKPINVQLRDGTMASVSGFEHTLFGTDGFGRPQSWRRDGVADDSGCKGEQDIVGVELFNPLTGKPQFFYLAGAGK